MRGARFAMVLCLAACSFVQAGPPEDAKRVLKGAVVTWHMNAPAGLSPARGGATFGVQLEGDELKESLDHGGDGYVVRLDDESLVAGEGANRELNITGEAITVLIRLKKAGGTWDLTPLSKHGGHERLQYNLYCFRRGEEFELGAEVGTSEGLARATTILPADAAPAWHDVALRYDGATLDLFFDGARRASSSHKGRLRAGSGVPMVIGGEPQGDGIARRFTGMIDHAAIWNRALTDDEIRVLNAGVATHPPEMRPLLRFTPEKNWMNDPNGMIYVDGEYHLFCQYNPFGDQWGHMSWGHAVSRDAIRWEHLPVAIPEADGVMAFSGTAVFDRENTSGFGKDGRAPLICVYTGHVPAARRQHQNLAYSLDSGRTWERYAGNPVIDLGEADFRDPKVFWHAPTARWVMTVALAAERKVLFFASPDLKTWTRTGEFGPAGRKDVPNWECPDLFELPIDGNPAERRWVLVINMGGNGPAGGSGCQYFIGQFDGSTFINENPSDATLWVDHGKDFYAFQSFHDAPDGRRIGLAWMVNVEYAGAIPTSPWRGSMTLPREFGLTRTPQGVRLTQRPFDDLPKTMLAMGGKDIELGAQPLAEGVTPTAISGRVLAFDAEFELGNATSFGVRICDSGDEFTLVGYDTRRGEMFVDRTRSGRVGFHPSFSGRHGVPLKLDERKRVTLRVTVDVGSVEAFGGDGLAAISSLIFPTKDGRRLSLFCEEGQATLLSIRGVVIP